MTPWKKTVSRPTKPVVTTAQSSLPSLSVVGAVTQEGMSPPHFSLIGVRHTNEPLPFRHHFGHEGGVDQNMIFNLCQELPVFSITKKDHVESILQASFETLRTLVTDAKFESLSHKPLVKPTFLFGDFVDFETCVAYDGDYKWLSWGPSPLLT